MDRTAAAALSVASHRLEGVELAPDTVEVLDRWTAGELTNDDLIQIENGLLAGETVGQAAERQLAQAA